jgi:ribose-phosphate pyrophosphokinase
LRWNDNFTTKADAHRAPNAEDVHSGIQEAAVITGNGVRHDVHHRHLRIFSGRASERLAQDVASNLGISCGPVEIRDFASGEIYSRFHESVRGSDAFVIQTHAPPINERIMEQLIMIDALKRASARQVSAVIPYFGYSRQDKKSRPREPISAKLVADLLHTAGADRIMSVDLHSGQIQGFFDGPVDHLSAVPLLADHVRLGHGDDLVVVAPDAGRVTTAERLARHLDAPLAFLYKRRNTEVAHQVEIREVVGDVADRRCVIIDDMIDTAGTVCGGAEVLTAHGARAVSVVATHAIFSDPAIERLTRAPIDEIAVTDTLPLTGNWRTGKIVQLSVAGILTAAITAVFEDASVSALFDAPAPVPSEQQPSA